MPDYTELKQLADRVMTDRRFCADEHHKALAEGVLAILAEIDTIRAGAGTVKTAQTEASK